MSVKSNAGHTMIELLIGAAILSVIGLMGFLALRSSALSTATANAMGEAQGSVRTALITMSSEIETAAKEEDQSIDLEEVRVMGDGTQLDAGEEGTAVVFQIPLDETGETWSTPIRYEWINEDENGNGLLDADEDVNEDGLLTRSIMRSQDLNGDGDTDDDGEERLVGAANDLAFVSFSINDAGDLLTIRMRGTKAMTNSQRLEGGTMQANLASASATSRVYILN